MIITSISRITRLTRRSFIVALLSAIAASSAVAAPFVNGDFEAPGGPPNEVALGDGSAYVVGWTVSGTQLFYEGPGNSHGWTAQSGNFGVSFGHSGSVGGALSQTFDTVAGRTYTVTYFVRAIQGGSSNQAMVAEVFDAANSQPLNSAATAIPANQQAFVQGTTLTFTAASSSSTLRFRDTTPNGGATTNWALDNVVVNRDPVTLTVTNTDNTGSGSLREAMAIAQSGDTIDFSVTGTITLSSTLVMNKSLTIQGPAAPGITISGNNAVRVLQITGSNRNVTLNGLTISNGRIDQTAPGGNQYFGGGIFNESTGTLTLTGCTVSNNTANNANSGLGYGAGIYTSTGSALVITNSTFTGNVADGSAAGHGSAIYTNFNNSDPANVTITGSTFSNNSSTSSNGQARGAVVHPNGQLTISGSTFSGNIANGRSDSLGASVFAAGGSITVTASTFTGNTSGQGTDASASFAPAIYQGEGGSLTVGNSTFSQNSAKGLLAFGGAIYGTDVTVTGTNFSGNSVASSSSQGSGGAIFANVLSVDTSTFTENSASSSAHLGAGGCIFAGALTITNSNISRNFVDNTFVGYGGAIAAQGPSVSIINTTISDNYSRGALTLASIVLLGGDQGFASISGCTISGNYSESTPQGAGFGDVPTRGGAIFTGTRATIVNSTLSGNSARSAASSGQGGAIYNPAQGRISVRNTTIAGNFVTGANNSETNVGTNSAGGGIYNEPPQGSTPGGTVVLRHTIVAANNATNAGPDLRHEFLSQAFNLVGNGEGSTGLVQGTNGDQVGTSASPIDPRLTPLGDYGGPTLTRALLSDSPARNAGDPAFPVAELDPAITTDQRGLARVRDSRIDIGAYEAPPPAVITVPANGARTNGTPTISGTAEPGSTVVVRISDGNTVVTVTTTADSSGNWSVNSSALATGNYSAVAGAGMGNEATVASSNTRTFVVDATPPVISGVSDTTVEATGPNGATVTYSPTATDNVDGNLPVSCSPASGSTFVIGSSSVVCSATDNVGNTGTRTFVVTVQDTTPPTITVPADIVVYNETGKNGASVSFSVSATDIVDGSITPTANPASGSVFPLGMTTVTVTATDSRGNSGTRTFNVTVRATEMANISTRVPVGANDNEAGIGGFIVQGGGVRRIVVRAIGPSLTAGGAPVPNRLENPTLQLFRSGSNEPIATNDDWQTSPDAGSISAVGLAPNDPRESAILADLPEGAYTAVIRGAGGSAGNALVEVYAVLTDAPAFLANISTRGLVQTGDNVLIAGVIVRGGDPQRLLIRALGPDLANRGVSGALEDPTLTLFDENGVERGFNNNWRENEQAVNETNMPPNDDRESAIVATLSSGNYTAVVRGAGETTGVGLVEVYNVSAGSNQQ